MTIDLETLEVVKPATQAEAETEAEVPTSDFPGLVAAEDGSLVPNAPPYTEAQEPEPNEESQESKPSVVTPASSPRHGSTWLLADGKLRTEQLRYLNRQRCIGIRNWREVRKEALKGGAQLEELPVPPAVQGRSIRVCDLRYLFEEPTHCKWCRDRLTHETLMHWTFRRSHRTGEAAQNIEKCGGDLQTMFLP